MGFLAVFRADEWDFRRGGGRVVLVKGSVRVSGMILFFELSFIRIFGFIRIVVFIFFYSVEFWILMFRGSWG